MKCTVNNLEMSPLSCLKYFLVGFSNIESEIRKPLNNRNKISCVNLSSDECYESRQMGQFDPSWWFMFMCFI